MTEAGMAGWRCRLGGRAAAWNTRWASLLIAAVVLALSGCTSIRGVVNYGAVSGSFTMPSGGGDPRAASPVEGVLITVTAEKKSGGKRVMTTTTNSEGFWSIRLPSDVDLTHRMSMRAERRDVATAVWAGLMPSEDQFIFTTVRQLTPATIVR